MNSTILNFFRFLDDGAGIPVPTSVKLRNLSKFSNEELIFDYLDIPEDVYITKEFRRITVNGPVTAHYPGLYSELPENLMSKVSLEYRAPKGIPWPEDEYISGYVNVLHVKSYTFPKSISVKEECRFVDLTRCILPTNISANSLILSSVKLSAFPEITKCKLLTLISTEGFDSEVEGLEKLYLRELGGVSISEYLSKLHPTVLHIHNSGFIENLVVPKSVTKLRVYKVDAKKILWSKEMDTVDIEHLAFLESLPKICTASRITLAGLPKLKQVPVCICNELVIDENLLPLLPAESKMRSLDVINSYGELIGYNSTTRKRH